MVMLDRNRLCMKGEGREEKLGERNCTNKVRRPKKVLIG